MLQLKTDIVEKTSKQADLFENIAKAHSTKDLSGNIGNQSLSQRESHQKFSVFESNIKMSYGVELVSAISEDRFS